MSQKIKIVFLTILTLIIMNCGNVFASTISIDEIEAVINEYNSSYVLKDEVIEKFRECISTYNYCSINAPPFNNWDKNIYFYFYNDIPTINDSNNVRINNYRRIKIMYTDNSSYWDDLGSQTIGFYDRYYTESGFYKTGTTEFKTGFEPGATNMDAMAERYYEPYFEFSANKIGTTTLENFDGQIPCFYPKSFESYSNSYASFKEIGKLYIDEDYEISQLYTSVPDINIYNLTQTQSWSYKNYLIFTDNIIVKGYKIYKINIDLNYIKTPYIYTMKLKNLDSELASDISIDFVLLTQTTEGGIVVESGDTEVSGDLTKDETTLGDIQNTIENIFQEPNEEELKQEQENNINEIKNQITKDLEKNKVFSALTTAEQGLIELLEGEPRRF